MTEQLHTQEPEQPRPRLPWLAGRLPHRIAAELGAARAENREIDEQTARQIAYLLGRVIGPDSALCRFVHTGQPEHDAMRDEYLQLYNDPAAPPEVREWINWLVPYFYRFDTAVIEQSRRAEHPPLPLDVLQVPVQVSIDDVTLTVFLPASYGRADIDAVTDRLADLEVDRDPAMQAYLQLPDVNPVEGDLVEGFNASYVGSFSSISDIVHELLDIEEFESDVHNYAAEYGLLVDSLAVDYEALMERLRDIYDFITLKSVTYTFEK